MQVLKKPKLKIPTEWDLGDVYYQLVEPSTKTVEATLHLRSWNVGASRANLARNYLKLKEPKEVRFITRDEYRAIIWPKRGRRRDTKKVS